MQVLTFNPSNTNADKFVLFKFNFLKFFKAKNKEIHFIVHTEIAIDS